jgi:SOS-response transcriptional repressor LexA
MPDKLTEKEREFVAELQRREDADPDRGVSYDEMREALGLRSKSGVARLVTSLRDKGWISARPYRARTLRLLHRLTEVASGPDPGSASGHGARGVSPLADATDDEIVAEVERRGLQAAVVAAYEFDVAARRIGKRGTRRPD